MLPLEIRVGKFHRLSVHGRDLFIVKHGSIIIVVLRHESLLEQWKLWIVNPYFYFSVWNGWFLSTTTVSTASWLTRWVSARPFRPSLWWLTWWRRRRTLGRIWLSCRCRRCPTGCSSSRSGHPLFRYKTLLHDHEENNHHRGKYVCIASLQSDWFWLRMQVKTNFIVW